MIAFWHYYQAGLINLEEIPPRPPKYEVPDKVSGIWIPENELEPDQNMDDISIITADEWLHNKLKEEMRKVPKSSANVSKIENKNKNKKKKKKK